MKLKAIRVKVLSDKTIEVIPVFYSKRGGALVRTDLKGVAGAVADAVSKVVESVALLQG